MPTPVTPPDTNDRDQRESREVPIDKHSINLWELVGAGIINSTDVDKRGHLSPAASPNAVPLSLTRTRFQMQERPVFPRPTTPPPPPPPSSPPPAPRKELKRAPLGRIDNKVYAREIKELEGEICALKQDKARLKTHVHLQAKVIDGFCHLYLSDYGGQQ